MALPDICLVRNGEGSGSYTGGAGPGGAASGNAGGSGVQDSGLPFIMLTTTMQKTVEFGLYATLCGKDPVDLTGLKPVFLAKEIYNDPGEYIRKDMTIVGEETEGRVSLTFTPADLPYAGIWPSAVMLFDSQDRLVDEFRCYLYVQRSLSDTRMDNRPLTIPEVRMALRDTCPGYNTLLDDLEFSDTEIAYAMGRPIDEWNETPPNIAQATFTQATFPWREPWLRATCGLLMQTAAHHYLRNDMRVAAGGLDIDDKAKHAAYYQVAQSLRQEWLAWMMRKKREINMNQCFGTLRSASFGSRSWRRRI